MASSQLMTKNESPATTATEETSGLESAVVFEGESLKTCGHTHKWVPLMDYLESCGSKKTLCPTCKAPIVLVCDGTATMGHNDNSQDEQHKRMVTFKYRNHLYKLSVQRAHGGGFPVPLSYCIWLWRSMLQIMGENTSVTVQERISQALRMDMEGHMKILHKGKIIYPDPQLSSHVISEKLLDVCEKGGKPLVMGTRMSDRQYKIATGKWMVRLYLSVIRVCLTKTISLVHGLVSPFLPMGGQGPAVDQRPHED